MGNDDRLDLLLNVTQNPRREGGDDLRSELERVSFLPRGRAAREKWRRLRVEIKEKAQPLQKHS